MNFHQLPVMHVGEVGLKVMDLDKMVRFYKEIIGLNIVSQSATEVLLGAGGKGLVKLKASAEFLPQERRYAGLYHFAILLPDRISLGKVLLHLHRNSIQLGSSDHLVSEALYLSDPEGNGIEIYADRDPALWEWEGQSVRMAVDPIDAESLMQEALESGQPWKEVPEQTVMGHIHLHMSNLHEAKQFYAEGIGFEIVAAMQHALFLSDERYHHHVGLNTWKGTGIPALPENRAGLSYYTLVLADEEKRRSMADRLAQLGADIREQDEYIEVRDPSGNKIRLIV